MASRPRRRCNIFFSAMMDFADPKKKNSFSRRGDDDLGRYAVKKGDLQSKISPASSISFGELRSLQIRVFTDQKMLEMSVSEFIEKWPLHCSSKGDIEDCRGKSLLYLEGWHFARAHENLSMTSWRTLMR